MHLVYIQHIRKILPCWKKSAKEEFRGIKIDLTAQVFIYTALFFQMYTSTYVKQNYEAIVRGAQLRFLGLFFSKRYIKQDYQ